MLWKCLQHPRVTPIPGRKLLALALLSQDDAMLQNGHSLFWQMHCFCRVSSESGQIKPRPENGAFQRSCQTSHIMTVLWNWDFLKGSKPILPLPVVTKFLIFTTTIVAKLNFSRLPWSWERGIGLEQIKTPQSSLFLPRFSSSY